MKSEKVKEIKKALKCCSSISCPSYCPLSGYHSDDYETLCRDKLVKDSLTLINELESENKLIQREVLNAEVRVAQEIFTTLFPQEDNRHGWFRLMESEVIEYADKWGVDLDWENEDE